ncbi:MAG: hypothetical protein K0S68_1025 [Candidatus Saccharibacteria bacterium]|jgi:DNA-binding PadR family transcriptional regulator|nr:hypothetical protein [Candidatus Saccharibacteria bacterium]
MPSHRFLSYDDLLILLAISAGANSALAAYDQIISDTVGDYVERASLYRHLHSLIKRGYLDERYTLTEKGATQLRHAASDWQRLAAIAKERVATLPAYP